MSIADRSPSLPGGGKTEPPCAEENREGWFHHMGRWFHLTWGYERHPEEKRDERGPDEVFRI
jgi:hypothetical protein